MTRYVQSYPNNNNNRFIFTSSIICKQQIEIYNDFFLIHLPFKRQPHKMVKHTETIRQQLPTKFLRVFDHFVSLSLKGLMIKETWIFVYKMKKIIKDFWRFRKKRDLLFSEQFLISL